MKEGYGRGYYGAGQLAPSPSRRRNWFNVVAVVGLGAAVVWLLWPRNSLPSHLSGNGVTKSEPPPQAPSAPQLPDDEFARSRGFSSVKEYEDSMIASAKQLQAAGAQVVLAPHLQHLAPRLEA